MSSSRTWPLRNSSIRSAIGASVPFSWTDQLIKKLVTTWKSTNNKRKQGSRQKQNNVSTRSRKNALRTCVSKSKSMSFRRFNMRKRRQSSSSTAIMWSRASPKRKLISKCSSTMTSSTALMISHTHTEMRSKELRRKQPQNGEKNWKSNSLLKEPLSQKRRRKKSLSSENKYPMKTDWKRRQRRVLRLRTTKICSTCRPNHTCYAISKGSTKSSLRIRNRRLFTIHSFKSHRFTPKSIRLCCLDQPWMIIAMPTQFWEMLESVLRWSSCEASKRKLKMRRSSRL